MKLKPKTKYVNSRAWQISTLIFVLLLISGGLVWSKINANLSTEQTYHKQLISLSQNIETIESLSLENRENLSTNIDLYEEALVNSLGLCRQMNTKHEGIKNLNTDKSLQDKSARVSQLCVDLERVLEYARKVSNRTAKFILYPSTSLVSQKSADNILAFQQLTIDTRSNLEQLKKQPLNDPGLDELITILSRIELQAKTARSSQRPDDVASLVQQVEVHQVNFLNARAYFWKNTVEIGYIKLTITELTEQFEA